MPELPEVETVRRGLEPLMQGRRISQVEILDPRLVMPESPAVVERQLTGRRVERLERRGKYLILVLDRGVAIHHLRMTGSFGSGPAGAEPPHVRMRYRLGRTRIWYRDPRRFGTLSVLDPGEADAYLDARLGPEPLEPDFTPAVLRASLKGRRGPIKAVLLDQRVVAGLGNIYVDEALHQARIHPLRSAGTLSPATVRLLHTAIVDRLEAGIRSGGSTLRDYRAPSGETGNMQDEFAVYGRRGLPCLACGGALRGFVVGGRSTVACPRCQRPPRT